MKTLMKAGGFAVLMGLVACAKPPAAEIAAVKTAVESARTSGATEYAPESLRAAEDALAKLETEVKAQEARFAWFRKYDQAKVLIAEVQKAADRAVQDAAAERERVKQETAAAIADVRKSLDEAKVLLAEAPTGKGTEADIEALKGDLAGVEAALGEVQKAFEDAKYGEAKTRAQAARERAEAVKAAVQAAKDAQAAAQGGTAPPPAPQR